MHVTRHRLFYTPALRHFSLALLVWATLCGSATAQNTQKDGSVQSQRMASQNYCMVVKGYEMTSSPGLFLGVMNSDHNASQWRKYHSKDELRKVNANGSAYVWIRDAKVVGVFFMFQDESGDWVNYASYCFREDGSIAEVDSVLQTFYGNMLVKRAWFYAPQGALLARTMGFFDLHTEKPKTPDQAFIDEKTPQFRDVKSLPFSSLLPDSKSGK